jgi:hypothetical protein
MDRDFLAMLMEYIMDLRDREGRSRESDGRIYEDTDAIGNDMGMTSINGGSLGPATGGQENNPWGGPRQDFDMGGDGLISAMGNSNPAQYDTSPSTYGGPPPRQQSLGELLALHGLYNPGPARPLQGQVSPEFLESERRRKFNEQLAMSGLYDPGPATEQRDNSVSAKPDPQARPVTPRVPLGLQSPRNLPPSYTPERARPASRPVPARGISYPIQAAKRIQQAAVQPQARPQISTPMSPGTLRSLTRR